MVYCENTHNGVMARPAGLSVIMGPAGCKIGNAGSAGAGLVLHQPIGNIHRELQPVRPLA